MIHSTIWRGESSLVDMEIIETAGVFTGTVQLFHNGERLGEWTGGRYGIGTEWTELRRAQTDLCVFMIWVLDSFSLGDQLLIENVAHGQERADKAAAERKINHLIECEEENLLADLEEGRQLCQESIRELDLYYIPKAGPQIDLF